METKNKELGKQWELTEERALQIYETLQQALDPNTWTLPIKSKQNESQTFQEFKNYAKKRLNPWGHYSPTTIIEDCFGIFDSLFITMENIKSRVEDSFKSILIVNENMNTYVDKIHGDIELSKEKVSNIEKENTELKDELARIKDKLKKHEEGIEPLINVIQERVKHHIKYYNDFKEAIGDEERMKEFIPMFQNEVDITIKLVELHKKNFLGEEEIKEKKEDSEQTKETDKTESEKEGEVSDQQNTEPIQDGLVEDEEKIPVEFADFPEKVYKQAVNNLKNREKILKTSGHYNLELHNEIDKILIKNE